MLGTIANHVVMDVAAAAAETVVLADLEAAAKASNEGIVHPGLKEIDAKEAAETSLKEIDAKEVAETSHREIDAKEVAITVRVAVAKAGVLVKDNATTDNNDPTGHLSTNWSTSNSFLIKPGSKPWRSRSR